MGLERLLLVLPTGTSEAGLRIPQWVGLVEEFSRLGGRELVLGGPEPLGFGGFWVLVRRAEQLGLPRITAFLSGGLLEPWVIRRLTGSHIHLMISLDSLKPEVHDTLHGPGAHARAVAAIDALIAQGIAPRLGLLATATRLNLEELPALAAWAGSRGLPRLFYTAVPDEGWPSFQLKSLRLTSVDKAALAAEMDGATHLLGEGFHAGPLEAADVLGVPSQVVRVLPSGEAVRGFAGEGGALGHLRWATLQSLLDRVAQAAGD